MNTQYQIITGSLGQIAQVSGKSIAETFVGADAIVIVDVSGSMGTNDSRNGQSRYAVACDELANIQNTLPGKIAVIAFNNLTTFVPNGIPPTPAGGTRLDEALKFARIADIPGMHFVLISDGEPESELHALSEASKYKNKIDVIYVGPEEFPDGREFLAKLAALTGGKTVTADRAQALGAGVMQLLERGN